VTDALKDVGAQSVLLAQKNVCGPERVPEVPRIKLQKPTSSDIPAPVSIEEITASVENAYLAENSQSLDDSMNHTIEDIANHDGYNSVYEFGAENIKTGI
jgi:hypothetical protein